MFDFLPDFLPDFTPVASLIHLLSQTGIWHSIVAFFADYNISQAMLFKIAEATDETLYMTIISAICGGLLGLPIGVLLYTTNQGQIMQNRPLYTVLSLLVNIFRAIPFIILIFWLIPVTRMIMGSYLGVNGALVPLSIGVAPLIARMVENALLEVPKGLIEAARSMGASSWQIICKVLLPEARPVLVNSVTITLITLINYTAMAGAIGAGGLGNLAYQYGYTRFQPAVMNFIIILLIVIVFAIQYGGDKIVKRVTHH